MSTPKETKSPPSATVFGQKPTKLAVKILQSILTSYGHKLKAQELRRGLLEQVICMEDKISTIQWDKFSCPLDGRQLSADVVRPFDTLWELQPIRNEPNFRWCANPKCDWGHIHDSGQAEPKITFEKCSSLACFTHQRPWHEGQTCKEFNEQPDAEQKQQLAALEKTIKQTSARCLKCSRPITKVAGCGFVTCFCGHPFDWNAAVTSITTQL
ncbi:uncharacterized protein K444DRAFT_720406 [Hyaloscypha bicolor E]|uniref:IBR domain-containing protein n=1 Tax=Hyaloscypha bicolor E TaxID=1095630 RepID=A0A2J6TCQ3_9HELO|nr:uncharacterized protein K444DRAFT_720406 [Hyaloscypha bicolor E]PMD60814.1 hypothetical protein K444DRAFT_720406 [Hyaloscypha bicolor E]